MKLNIIKRIYEDTEKMTCIYLNSGIFLGGYYKENKLYTVVDNEHKVIIKGVKTAKEALNYLILKVKDSF